MRKQRKLFASLTFSSMWSMEVALQPPLKMGVKRGEEGAGVVVKNVGHVDPADPVEIGRFKGRWIVHSHVCMSIAD